ncbi:YcnI family copper-binding membrane protein [Nocardia tengchongensis]|uniref:YcnI family copper-binding membrane protein n=1 Tax=Nocardia tengchongensis TaxID=2055889 RepID=UPI0036BEB5C3
MAPTSVVRGILTAALSACALLGGAGVASAHVAVSAPDATRSGDAVLTFRVPNESGTGSTTTALTVQFPGLVAVVTQAMPGWKSVTAKDAAGKVTAVTWTADPGAGIALGQFAQFQVLADGLPDQDRITLPAIQTYSDGEVVKWDQPNNPDGIEPERPVPTLELTSAPPEGHSRVDSHDSTARWAGGVGIALGALALLVAVGSGVRRRS